MHNNNVMGATCDAREASGAGAHWRPFLLDLSSNATTVAGKWMAAVATHTSGQEDEGRRDEPEPPLPFFLQPMWCRWAPLAGRIARFTHTGWIAGLRRELAKRACSKTRLALHL
jgi:hypothetical protein